MITEKKESWISWFSLIIVLTIGFFFIIFTYLTPEIFIFQDPISGGYGIIEHYIS
ncbi:MAG: hypothetical protein BAJALOKI2v1_80033 [Promethearchaeota archaeon]|nr:MAG: hypothetical protein BAJALOKI2v1_80033 [Candidatus Lokiarchaeota archaeon]